MLGGMMMTWLVRQVTEALMVLKWGGSLTDVGLEQASRLGQRFREELFPGTPSRLSSQPAPGCCPRCNVCGCNVCGTSLSLCQEYVK